MGEFEFFDGEEFVEFIVEVVSDDYKTALIVVLNRGKISLLEYDLFEDKKGLYFEYKVGPSYNKIYIEEDL